ncbi:MAG: response regulator [Proteobacteria bacterium]|nr:response regulator [Pseudomonadota bacterium]
MNHLMVSDKADVLMLDDQPENLHLLTNLLGGDFRVHPFSDASKFMAYVEQGKQADLILLDVVMPGRDGYEVCAWLRGRRELEHVPIIFLTSLTSAEDERKGLGLGANDYIGKPFSPPIVLTRVRHHVSLGRTLRIIADQNDHLDEKVRERTVELERANTALRLKSEEIEKVQDATIIAFSSLAETRDNETGLHLRRTQNYVRELAGELKRHPRFAAELDDTAIQLLYKSAPLHDIGKVAIPDHILLKPGKLTPEEFDIMKTHAAAGRDAIAAAENGMGEGSSFLSAARDIAYGHHEKWDGSGYPQGLAGEAIPLFARIMAVADVYDALISNRVYKAGMPHAKAAGIITEGRGSHFDPDICDHFLLIQQRFASIAAELNDAGPPA